MSLNINALDDDTPLAVEEPKTAEQRSELAIRENIGRVEGAISEFDRIAAGLAELHRRFPVDLVYDVTTTKGMAEATAHRAAWRDPRIAVEKFRKAAKAPVLQLGKDIDARAAWITEQLLLGEEPIDKLIKAEEQRKREERQAREMAETKRLMDMQDAIAGIHMEVMAVSQKTAADMQALLDEMRGRTLDPLVYQEMIDQAKAALAAAISKLETGVKAKLWEEDQARLRAEAEEAARKRRAEEDAERARIAAEQKVEADRLATERVEIARERAALAAAQEAARKAAEPPPAPAPAPVAVVQPTVAPRPAVPVHPSVEGAEYSYSWDEESFAGCFDSIEAALAMAADERPDDGFEGAHSVYIGENRDARSMFKPEWIGHCIEEYISEMLGMEVGEAAENFSLTREQQVALGTLVLDWIEAGPGFHCYGVKNIKQYTLPAASESAA